MSNAYSNCGLTIIRYADSLTRLEQLLKLHFKKSSVLYALVTIVEMCGDQDKDLCKVTPK